MKTLDAIYERVDEAAVKGKPAPPKGADELNDHIQKHFDTVHHETGTHQISTAKHSALKKHLESHGWKHQGPSYRYDTEHRFSHPDHDHDIISQQGHRGERDLVVKKKGASFY